MRCTSIHFPLSGNSIRARADFLSSANLYCGRLAITRRLFGSKIVISGLPGADISPASTWRSATTPAIGAVTLPCDAPAPDAATAPCAALNVAAAWSSAAWLMNFCACRFFARS
jgi:hypothetical protein